MLAAPLSLRPAFEGQKERNGGSLQCAGISVHHSGCAHTVTQRPDSGLCRHIHVSLTLPVCHEQWEELGTPQCQEHASHRDLPTRTRADKVPAGSSSSLLQGCTILHRLVQSSIPGASRYAGASPGRSTWQVGGRCSVEEGQSPSAPGPTSRTANTGLTEPAVAFGTAPAPLRFPGRGGRGSAPAAALVLLLSGACRGRGDPPVLPLP